MRGGRAYRLVAKRRKARLEGREAPLIRPRFARPPSPAGQKDDRPSRQTFKAPPMTNPLVFFAPSGKRGRFPEGTSVLEAARKLGVDLDSVCGGRGICGRCQVELGEGKFPKLGIDSAPEHV